MEKYVNLLILNYLILFKETHGARVDLDRKKGREIKAERERRKSC
jgi:hypothetical protein